MWKSSVVNASDHIFPGLAYHDRKKEFYDIGIYIFFTLFRNEFTIIDLKHLFRYVTIVIK